MLCCTEIRRNTVSGVSKQCGTFLHAKATMSYGEAKVYFDGSHYIAIPHTERKTRYRPKREEERITVVTEREEAEPENSAEPFAVSKSDETRAIEQVDREQEQTLQIAAEPPQTAHTTTRKELFDELYAKHISLPMRQRKAKIRAEMRPFFDTDEDVKNYVELGFERKQRNMICRRIRMIRKANLAQFNYFCTFTYDDKLHTEESFKKGLQTCFRNFCYRKAWKYMGVWERSPQMQRLHFHGLFAIPENSLPSDLTKIRDYSTKEKRMQVSTQCEYFTKRFGRNDFKELDPRLLGESIKYLLKYIEKTGERIVYSKGLYQYFISDIMDEDVVCTIGEEDKKLLLFDTFNCWDEGVYMGRVSPEVIAQMRKSN